MNIYYILLRRILMEKGKLHLTDEIEQVYEKTIIKFGTEAKIDAPKDSIGNKVYVLIRKK